MNNNRSFSQSLQPGAASCFLGVDIETGHRVMISDAARLNGWHIIGGTGSGKTTLTSHTLSQDRDHGHGILYLTNEPDAVRDIIARSPENALSRMILVDPGDAECHIGMNQLYCPESNDPDAVERVLDRQLHIFKKIWGEESGDASWGPQLEDILSHSLLTLIYNQLTLAELPLLLRDEGFRRTVVKSIKDKGQNADVVDFWEKDFNKWPYRSQILDTRSTLNKVRAFLRKRKIKHIIGQKSNTLDFQRIIDEKLIVLVPLSERVLGEEGVKLIGTMIVSQLLDAALFRQYTVKRALRELFAVYVDEFELFASADFKTMLERVRKCGIAVTIAHQTMGGLRGDRSLQEAVNQTANKTQLASLTPSDAELFARLYTKEPVAQETRREVVEAIPHKPIEKLTKIAHPNATINAITSEYLSRLAFFSANLEADKPLVTRGCLSSRMQLATGMFLLDRLFTDVMTRRLSTHSGEIIRRVSQIVLVLQGFIGFTDSARMTEKHRLTHRFEPNGGGWLGETGIVPMDTRGTIRIEQYNLPTGDFELTDVAPSGNLHAMLTAVLFLEAAGNTQDAFYPLPLTLCHRLGLSRVPAVKQIEEATLQKDSERLKSSQAVLLKHRTEKEQLIKEERQVTEELKIKQQAREKLEKKLDAILEEKGRKLMETQRTARAYPWEWENKRRQYKLVYKRNDILKGDGTYWQVAHIDSNGKIQVVRSHDLVTYKTAILTLDAQCQSLEKRSWYCQSRLRELHETEQRLKAIPTRITSAIQKTRDDTSVLMPLTTKQRAKALNIAASEIHASPEALHRLLSFAKALMVLCELLKDPINIRPIAEHGGYREVEGNKSSEADMVGAAVRQLLNLEPLTALCRIQNPLAPEGERIKKHKIRIPLPPPGVSGIALEHRINVIREQSRRRYYTPSLTVESQIRERQALFTRLPQRRQERADGKPDEGEEPPPPVRS